MRFGFSPFWVLFVYTGCLVAAVVAVADVFVVVRYLYFCTYFRIVCALNSAYRNVNVFDVNLRLFIGKKNLFGRDVRLQLAFYTALKNRRYRTMPTPMFNVFLCVS